MQALLNSSRLQAALTLFWVGMVPVSLVAGWVHSVTFVSALSLWKELVDRTEIDGA